MNYYQLFYNASECGLSGKSGFGVRTATEGVSQEFINAVEGDEFLHIYPTEDYGIKDSEIVANPERIVEYPRTYYYRRLPVADGREVFMVGRIVYALYDYSFYSGTSKRTGNLINHIYLFEEKPDPVVFDMLLEEPAANSNGFLPRNWAPRADNPEMLKLMLGKPERLPVEDRSFRSSHIGICDKAYTLYFQYLEFRNNNKPILVRSKASETGEIIAGLMRLLPPHMAKELTFVTNHQDNGIAKGVRITFVNEFYPNQIYTATCDYVDLIDGTIPSTSLENTYRKALETLGQQENGSEMAVLSVWVCSDIAYRNVSHTREFNLALFNYVHKPDAFSYDDLEKNEGLIAELASIVGNDENKAQLLNIVLSKSFDACISAGDFKRIIEMTEKCKSAGLPVTPAIEVSKRNLTEKAIADIHYLSSCLSVIGENKLERYADRSAFPKLDAVFAGIVKSDLSEDDKKKLVCYLEPDAKKRVECSVAEICKSPAEVDTYRPWLDIDKSEADNVDWLEVLKDNYTVEAIADLLFGQTQRHPKETKELVNLYSELSDKNPAFKSLVIKNAGSIYLTVYSYLESKIGPSDFEETKKFIDEKIRPFIKDEAGVSKRYDRLCRVMNAEVDNVDKPEEYWALAVRINSDDSLKKLLPACFGSFSDKDTVFGFVNTLLERGILDNDGIVEHVCSHTGSDASRAVFWRALKKYGGYSGYDSIYDLGKKMNVSEETIEDVFKKVYPSTYKAHRREVNKKKLVAFLKKKPVWISCLAVFVAAVCAVLYLTVVKKNHQETEPQKNLVDITAVSAEDSVIDSVPESTIMESVDSPAEKK